MDFGLSDEHKRNHLPALATVKWLGAMAYAEPRGANYPFTLQSPGGRILNIKIRRME